MHKYTRQSMIVVSVANGILLFGYGLSLPFFTIYLITQLHLAPALAGLVIALAGLSRCVSSAISGELADTFGRKAVMMWGLFSQIIAMFALGLCIEFHAGVAWVLLTYFLTTFLGAFFRPYILYGFLVLYQMSLFQPTYTVLYRHLLLCVSLQ